MLHEELLVFFCGFCSDAYAAHGLNQALFEEAAAPVYLLPVHLPKRCLQGRPTGCSEQPLNNREPNSM